MSLNPKDAKKFKAELVDAERIRITADPSTVVTRKIRESDRAAYPELFAAGADSKSGPTADELAAKEAEKQKKKLEREALKAEKAAKAAAAKEAEKLNESEADS